jgi:hypothetical protein
METTVNELTFTKSEAIKKGYLQEKKVYLKPILRAGKMITDPNHRGYFMWEGASKMFCLMRNTYGELVSPFKNEEEQMFFSKLLDVDLNPRKVENNFWYDFYVRVTKDHNLMSGELNYDLSDPMDNIRVRVLKQQKEIAPSWDQRFEHISYKFALVDEDFEEKVNTAEMDKMEAIWTYWGEIKNSPKKMKEFLSIYYMTKKVNKSVSDDTSREFLTSEIKKLIDKDSETVYTIVQDDDLPIKLFVYKAIKAGGVYKEGVGTYYIVGDDTKLPLNQFVDHIKFLKESTDPMYLKLEAQINTQKL